MWAVGYLEVGIISPCEQTFNKEFESMFLSEMSCSFYAVRKNAKTADQAVLIVLWHQKNSRLPLKGENSRR